MARIPLSVSSDYLPDWGVYHGLRELVQNYIDSQDDSGVEGEIRFVGGLAKGKVFLTNKGAKPLNRDALLFGVTSKVDRRDQRGQFGEGMKVGTLALVRAGRSVTIRTQTETWSASLTPSKEFGGRSVLTFDTRKRTDFTDTVEVEIDYVTRDEWKEIEAAFMFMHGEVASHRGYSGSILLDNKHKDTVFSKGILVKKMENMRFGYDLSDLTINRDRSMIDEWDVRSNVVNLLSEQYRAGTLALDDFMSMFLDNTWECQVGSQWMYTDVIKDLICNLVSRSTYEGCRGLVVTAKEDEAVKVESFGWVPVRVPKNLWDAAQYYLSSPHETYVSFRKKHGISTFAEMIDAMRDAVAEEYSPSDLDEIESVNLSWAVNILADAGIRVSPKVVRFVRDDELMGLFKSGEIFIGRRILQNKHECLGTLIHEWAHNFGGDGSIAHSNAIESGWVKVARLVM